MEKAISQIYQKKEKLVIIGLTGRTGADVVPLPTL